MKISNRLKLIASFVDDDSKVIDVGCDHALLDIFLVLNKKNIKAVASDINPHSLQMARRNIDKYGATESIVLSLGNGLEKMTYDMDTIVMSGMGGNTIIDILDNSKNLLLPIKTMVISPHNSLYEVRRYVTEIGYYIADEAMIYDQGKYYTVIKFKRGKKTYSDDQLFFGPILLMKRDAVFCRYCSELLQKDETLLKTIPQSSADHNRLQKEIEKLRMI